MPIAQFSGLASGIDSKALIDAIIEAKQTVNDKRKKEIDFLKSENDSLEELNTKLLKLSDLIDPFRTINGGGLNRKASSTDSTVATAVAGSNANNGSYSLTVTSVADSATASFNQTYASTSTAVSTSGSGTVSITVGTGSDQVTISATVTANSTTVSDLVTALNNDSDASGRFAASAVNMGTSSSPSYKIVLTSLQSGEAKGEIAVSASGAITELQAVTTDQATDAVFSISGISGNITRSTNSVSDVISGLTFNLNKAGTTTININEDVDATADRLKEIVDAYNDVVKFINENNIVTRDEASSDRNNIYGTLAKAKIDDDFLEQFRLAISTAAASAGTTVTRMSELGIETLRDGTLLFHEETDGPLTPGFKSQASADPVGATQVLNDFADAIGGVTGLIYQFTKLDGYIENAQDANKSQISNLNLSIAALDRQTEKLRESLTRQFANLESISGRLQNDQQALTSILAGLSR